MPQAADAAVAFAAAAAQAGLRRKAQHSWLDGRRPR